jgi:SET family sugar efflux transporter-like MFS transporter
MFLGVGISMSLVMPFLSLFLSTEVHATPGRITLFLVGAPLAGVLVASVIGRASDRFPIRRKILIGAALAGVAGSTTTAFVRDYWVLLGLAVTATAVAGSMFPQAFAYARLVLERDNPDRTAMGISTLRTVFSLAWVGGPPFATVALNAGGFRLLYGLAAVTYGMAALVATFWLKDLTPTPPRRAPEAARGSDRVRPPRVLLVTLAAFVLLQVPGTLGIQAMPLFIRHDLHGNPSTAGFVLGLCAALEIPLMLGLGSLTTRYQLRTLVLTGVGAGVAYYAIVLLAPNVWVLAGAQIVNAMYISAVAGVGISYVQDLLPGHPGYVTTLFTNTFPIGQAIAGPLLGVSVHFGYRLAYGLGTALCAAGLGLLLVARPRPLGRAVRPTPPVPAARTAPAGAPVPVEVPDHA